MKLTIPNCITSVRIFGAAGLLLTPPLSRAFYVIYTICGLSDALDGPAARLLKQASEAGARLDSIADLVFYTVSLVRMMPALWARLPRAIWYVVAMVLLIRLSAYGVAAARFRRFASVHTYLNKLTGVGVFLVPYFLLRPRPTALCAAVCAVALLASAEELALHLCQKTYRPDVKTILHGNKPV